MRMPQDFVDAINAAVKEVNPDAGTMVSGSMTLGSDFDEWLGPKAIMKYGPECMTPRWEMPEADQKAFEAMWAKHYDALKASVVASAVETEKKRMAGTLEKFCWNDSNRPAALAHSGKAPVDVREVVAKLDASPEAE